MTETRQLVPDPSARLTAAFRKVAARMQGLALVNPALDVEAVGFAPWERHWLGVMVTPWFMNLTLMPRDPVAWYPLAQGCKRRYAFPAGSYEFVGANDPAIGDFQVCSLFAPPLPFEDQATARLVAAFAREALFDPANAEVPEAGSPGPLARLQEQFDAPVSKRDFLRGRARGGHRDDRR